ncbi:MAG: LysE family transporter [candidate division Zixibacteria bacterium]|nr:LysE family transporter [candidate division Zixibacteria bacterium]
MELFSLFITSFIVGFSGAMMPGPLLAVTVAQTPLRGARTGPILTGGHAVAEIAVVVLLSVGLATVVNNTTVSSVIGIVGGSMLVLMGLGMLYELVKNKITPGAAETKSKKSGRLVLDGVLTSLSNPYWFVWWATTGSAFLVRSLKHGAVGPAVFYVGHILSDLVWYTFVSFLIWKGRRLIVGTGYKILMAVCALFLLYLGVVFIHDGISGAIS